MTDETKKLFDAPWQVDKVDFKSDIFGVGSTILRIFDKTEELITAHIPDEKTANRLASLPELYDALEQAANEFCEGCLVKHGYLDEEHSYYDLISNGCVLNAKGCKAFPWLKLLQKVMDGK